MQRFDADLQSPAGCSRADSFHIVANLHERNRTMSFKALQRPDQHYKLDLFEVISPRWSSLHANDEVTEWFTTNGLLVQRFAGVEYVGVNYGPPPGR